jgi:DNA-binding SARP family transcriptional activator
MPDKPVIIEMFGGFRIRRNGDTPVDLPRQQVGALLAYLALHPHRPHTRDELAEALWPESGDEAKQRFRQTLYALRKFLSEYGDELLLVTRSGVQMNRDAIRTDVSTLRQALRQAAQLDEPQERLKLLSIADSTYRGPLLPGFYQDWAVVEQERCADQHRDCLRSLATAHERVNDLPKAIEVAERLLQIDPLAEEAYCQLMKLYAATGRPAEVMRVYQELEQVLALDLNEKPSPKTTELMNALRDSGRAIASVIEPVRVTEARTRSAEPKPSIIPLAPAHEQPTSNVATPTPRQPLRWRKLGLGLATACLVSLLIFALAERFAPKPEGKKLWEWVYPGKPGDGDGEITGMVVDKDGNTYVTGFLDTLKQSSDMITLKLSPEGKLMWEQRYDGPIHDCDRARSIAIDSKGCVLVTGDTWNGELKEGRTGWDYLTIKYDPNGKELWKETWHNPEWKTDEFAVKVAVNDRDEIFVTGTSYQTGKEDSSNKRSIATLKYAPDRRLVWESVRPIKAGSTSAATDMTLDSRGLPIAVGELGGWNRIGMILVAYTQTGTFREQPYYGKSGGQEKADRVRTDSNGNIYVCGDIFNGDQSLGGTGVDAALLKFDADLKPLWTRTLATPLPSHYGDLVIDRDAVYIGGIHTDEFLVDRFDSSGSSRTLAQIKGIFGTDMCRALAVTQDHGLAAAGYVLDRSKVEGGTDSDAVILRFNERGEQLWHARWNNTTNNSSDMVNCVASDRYGNIIAAGTTQDGNAHRILVLKYSY